MKLRFGTNLWDKGKLFEAVAARRGGSLRPDYYSGHFAQTAGLSSWRQPCPEDRYDDDDDDDDVVVV